MTRRTRYFLSVSSGILLLGLCAGVVAYYSGLAPVAEGQAQRSDLDYIPADATVVAYADLKGGKVTCELANQVLMESAIEAD